MLRLFEFSPQNHTWRTRYTRNINQSADLEGKNEQNFQDSPYKLIHFRPRWWFSLFWNMTISQEYPMPRLTGRPYVLASRVVTHPVSAAKPMWVGGGDRGQTMDSPFVAIAPLIALVRYMCTHKYKHNHKHTIPSFLFQVLCHTCTHKKKIIGRYGFVSWSMTY